MSLRVQFFLSGRLWRWSSSPSSLESAVACWQARRSVVNEMTKALEAGDHVVDNALLSLPAGNSDPYLARLVSSFDGNRHVRVALVEAGRERATSHMSPPPEAVPGWFIRRLLDRSPPRARIDPVPGLGGRANWWCTSDPRITRSAKCGASFATAR